MTQADAPASKDRGEQANGVAIIGMSCRFPGAPDLDAYWRLLRDGVDAVTEVPTDRWDVESLYDPDPAAPGKMVSRWGGFLAEVDKFDAAFFGLSPRESNHVDPQQRFILEVAWEALEDAGLPPLSLARSQTGVFIATIATDYATDLFIKYADRIDAYSGTGTTRALNANRLSYFLDLRGPSITIDSACSGSLTAVQLACESLRHGESTLALAGGVNLILRADGNLFFSKAGALSPDGHCKPFDARANGIARSDGIGVVVLKPLARALADGDEIYAVILGGALNQDGHSAGVMAPNAEAQKEMLLTALRQAAIGPADVQYVECHGTGTNLGDPVEARALGDVFAPAKGADRYLGVGSVKSNIGHSEAAAGIASVIKVALAMRHRQIPPTIHFQQPNPLIRFDDWRLRVQRQLGPWPEPDRPLIAGVSSFGIGGANAHLLMSEAPARPAAGSHDKRREPDAEEPATAHLLTLSARSTAARERLAAAYRALLAAPGAPAWDAVCYGAALRRSHLEQRLALVARTREEAVGKLDDLLAGRQGPGVVTGAVLPGQHRRLAFVFSGQGTHWHGMGRRLLEREDAFAEVARLCDEVLAELAGWSLIEELTGPAEASRLAETAVAQPAIFAVQAGLAALWRAWGLEPEVVVGQSLGEVAAACTAGALELEDAVRVVFHRSRLMQRVAGQGATALIALAEEQARLALTGFGGEVVVAGSTSPGSTVVSGGREAVERLVASLDAQGVFARALKGVDVAFHSHHMDPLTGELAAELAGIRPRPAAIRLLSTVTGGEIAGEQLDADYWARNLRQPFRFAAALAELVGEAVDTYLEIGPHPVLAGSIRQILDHQQAEALVVGSLRRDADEHESLLEAVGQLHAADHPVNWAALFGAPRRRVKLPSYPWGRQRFWHDQLREGEDPPTGLVELRGGDGHPLLGLHVVAARPAGQHLWERDFTNRSLYWLDEHRIQGAPVLPATAHLEMARRAAKEVLGDGTLQLEEVGFASPLVLPPESGPRRVQLVLDADGGEQTRFRVFSRAADAAPDERWALHSSGRIRRVEEAAAPTQPLDVAAIRNRCTNVIDVREHYRRMELAGLEYGPSFRAMTSLQQRPGEAISRLELPPATAAEAVHYGLHPAILDAALQTLNGTHWDVIKIGLTYIPVSLGELRLYAPAGSKVWTYATEGPVADDRPVTRYADLTITDDEGRVVAEVRDLELRKIAAAGSARREHELSWRAAPADPASAEQRSTNGPWLIFADGEGVAEALGEQLSARGDSLVVVRPGQRWTVVDDGTIEIDPRRPEDYDQLVQRTVLEGEPQCRGIVHLWSLDAADPAELDLDTLERAAANGAKSVIWLLQALARAGAAQSGAAGPDSWRQPPRLWIATRGALAVGPDDGVAVAQAPVWGLGRVAAREHGELWGGLVDLDPVAAPAAAAAELLGELSVSGKGIEAAFREGERYAPALTPARRPGTDLRLRPDASYLITGGLGGLGLSVARWLAERGARRLFLAGRTALPPRDEWSALDPESSKGRKVAAVRALEAAGVSVHPVALDVADADRLAAFLDAFHRQGWPPLRGVVHAAGTLHDQLLARLSDEQFDVPWRPKATGAWLLHRALAGEELDFFVLFSSVASVLGSLGQANYAAGNAFLDALAHQRRAQGLPAVSINWGPWAEVGMAAGMDPETFKAQGGLELLAPREALESLAAALAADAAQLVVVKADWRQWSEKVPGRAAAGLVAALIEPDDDEDEHGASPGPQRGDLTDEILGDADPAEQRRRLEAWLGELCASVLRHQGPPLDPRQPLSALGFDSILTAEVRGRLRAAFGVEVPLTEMLLGGSIKSVTEAVLGRLASAETAAAAA